MKKNTPLLISAGILVIIVLLLLFTFQVRQTEVAVVTRFGHVVRAETKPDIYFRLPPGIDSIYKFENRIQTFEKKFEETVTRDSRPILVTVFVGWRIGDPQLFLERFERGNYTKAEATLENLVRNTKNAVLGQHPFSDLISTDESQLKFDQVEKEMLAAVQAVAMKDYGIEIKLLGIKQMGLPQSVTEAVFNRMRKERDVLIKQYLAEGNAEADKIKAEANTESARLISEAAARETEILGKAQAEVAKYYSVFEQNPDLATFLLKLNAIEASTRQRTTLILDQQTPPFDLLHQRSVELPAQGGGSK